MQRRALLLHLHFDDFLGVVPGAAGVSHENGLIKAEDRDGEKVADEKEWLDESESQRSKKNGDENVQHALLRVLGANLDDLLAVRHAGCRGTFQFDVGLDEFHSAVRSC